MSDLISRQEVRKAIFGLKGCSCSISESAYNRGVEDALRIIKALPSADRPTGHIVTKSSGKFNPTVWAECSECGKPIDPWDKFCRHCGAKMGDEDND